MPVLVYGLNHKTAVLDLRGRLSFTPTEIEATLCNLQKAVPTLTEVAMLVTCNRTEIHGFASSLPEDAITDWLAESRHIEKQEFEDSTYFLVNEEAIEHIFKVASGMDSQILGESQIHGQLKDAYRVAQKAGSSAKELSLVHEFTLQTAKRIRSETKIGSKPVSVALAAVTTAQQIFSEIGTTRVLLIGAGANIRKVTQHLVEVGAQNITFANRTYERSEELAKNFDGNVLPFEDIANQLSQYDLIVSSTSSPDTIVTKQDFELAVQMRKHKPMFIADLAVPRDIESEVGELKDIYLYNVDDLSHMVANGDELQSRALVKANEILADGLQCYEQKRRIQLGASLLRQYRSQVKQAQDEAVQKALAKLEEGDASEEVILRLASDLVNRLAHSPTMALRQASAQGDHQVLELLQEHFKLKD